MAEHPDTTHRLRVKIGTAEFEASGTEQSVREQYALFLKALGGTGARPALSAAETAPVGDVYPASPIVPGDVVSKAFAMAGTVLALKQLPKGDIGRSVLALLWGFDGLQGRAQVPAILLMQSLRASGIEIDRLDRVLTKHRGRYGFVGTKKGKSYGLTSAGRAYAAQVLLETFQ